MSVALYNPRTRQRHVVPNDKLWHNCRDDVVDWVRQAGWAAEDEVYTRWPDGTVLRVDPRRPDAHVWPVFAERIWSGKVRDLHAYARDLLVMKHSDRVSCFDVVLPDRIPHKGAVVAQMTAWGLRQVRDLVPVWMEAQHPPITLSGLLCTPFPVEVIVRGYLTGSAWRKYAQGARVICGVPLPNGLQEYHRFNPPIVTPTTKSDEKDEDTTEQEIVAQGWATAAQWVTMRDHALQVYQRLAAQAIARGLVLVDMKTEWGLHKGRVVLIDEVSGDSSRYWHQGTHTQMSKEFLREHLRDNLKWTGLHDGPAPRLSAEVIAETSRRYIALLEQLTGETLWK